MLKFSKKIQILNTGNKLVMVQMLLIAVLGFIFSMFTSFPLPVDSPKQPRVMMNTVMESQVDKLISRIDAAQLTPEALEKATGELEKLGSMDLFSPEAAEIKKYLGILLDLPWGIFSQNEIDLKKARQILDEDHYGMEKIKDKIMDFLAVQKRVGTDKAPILCFVGPPGVGKTSLARSIARATGREYQRIALGGIHDEALLRGHMRTYIGARPGRIIEAVKKAKTSNPVVLLDEIDKVKDSSAMGDPAAAMLEVLDAEQNNAFMDHYLEVPFNLSPILFIATANSLDNLPRPLLDRLEIIEVSSYTEQEKIEIAKRHIIPKQMKATGLKSTDINIDDSVLPMIIEFYTREAGVRSLERMIATVCRKVAKEISSGEQKFVAVNKDNLEHYLGVQQYERASTSEKNQVGVVTGLAWTEVGGECLSIEVITMAGSGDYKYTGNLGDVMQESIEAAVSYAKSNAKELGIQLKSMNETDFHVHVPAGGTPKDGPSAGIAMATAIVSALSKKPVRHDIAMTGEVTLSGEVIPIGGLKEKILAAQRAGKKTIIIPKKNEKDLKEIPDMYKKSVQIIPVSNVREVFKHAFVH
jgi:ATP-dependent Lon protease